MLLFRYMSLSSQGDTRNLPDAKDFFCLHCSPLNFYTAEIDMDLFIALGAFKLYAIFELKKEIKINFPSQPLAI